MCEITPCQILIIQLTAWFHSVDSCCCGCSCIMFGAFALSWCQHRCPRSGGNYVYDNVIMSAADIYHGWCDATFSWFRQGTTAIMRAARNDHTSCFDPLISHGANVEGFLFVSNSIILSLVCLNESWHASSPPISLWYVSTSNMIFFIEIIKIVFWKVYTKTGTAVLFCQWYMRRNCLFFDVWLPMDLASICW